jgi:hypothetical protein
MARAVPSGRGGTPVCHFGGQVQGFDHVVLVGQVGAGNEFAAVFIRVAAGGMGHLVDKIIFLF